MAWDAELADGVLSRGVGSIDASDPILRQAILPARLHRITAGHLASLYWIIRTDQSEFSRQWWMIPLVILGWSTFVLAEEFLFRGLLLPRMYRVFGKRDCFVNAFLFELYSIFQYWMVPFRFLEGWLLARAAKRHQSTWMAFVMRGVEGLAIGMLITVGVISQPLTASPRLIEFPMISTRPAPMTRYLGKLADIPIYNPYSGALFQVDLRGADLSSLDLRGRINDLSYADFDLHTIWPDKNQMPVNFDPTLVLEIGKNPGLGVRDLHAQGITGKGVGVAIIDQTLLTEHIEYTERLRWYEELPGYPSPASFHGSAVASIAVGQTVGVAPEADLYYIGGAGSQISTFWALGHQYAQAIRRIIQINAQLPAEGKIRIISISSGWLPSLPGYQDACRAVKEAGTAGMMVITTDAATGMPSGVYAEGLGRPPTADPVNLLSYTPGLWWANTFYAGTFQNTVERDNMLLFPMDSRTMASFTGASDYIFNRSGGQSWVVPYIAGLYALTAQVDPAITPQQFWNAAIQAGKMIEIQHDGKIYTLGKIIDPTELINIIKDSH